MTVDKKERRGVILELVTSRPISCQRELLEALRKRGFEATQATISRDIRELNLVKVSDHHGGYRYLPVQDGPTAVEPRAAGVVKWIKISGNLLVVNTLPGSAQSVAAMVDSLGWREVLGTVGGDDTVLVVVEASPGVTEELRRRLAVFFYLDEDNGSN